ncbi:hypothetical protein, partial [Streptomyces sp. SID10815]|uniref:hypothetical protein n=1 Tax=Streptomyces sp. SID10815 TaxID=2706027 RepID=UPI0013C66C7F
PEDTELVGAEEVHGVLRRWLTEATTGPAGPRVPAPAAPEPSVPQPSAPEPAAPASAAAEPATEERAA